MDKTPEQQAEELLPCQWSTRLCNPKVEELCYGCQHRPAVAAALGAKDPEVALYRESANSIRNTWNTACAEIERLKKQIGLIDDESEHGQCVHAGSMGPLDCVFCISWAKRNAQLRSQLAEISVLVAWPTDDVEPPYRNLPASDVLDRVKKIVAQAERKG